MSRMQRFQVSALWTTEDLAIFRLIVRGPHLLTIGQISHILSKESGSSRKFARRCKRLIQRCWLHRYELLVRFPRPHEPVHVHINGPLDWKAIRQQRVRIEETAVWKRRCVLTPTKQTSNLFGCTQQTVEEIERRPRQLNWGSILAKVHQRPKVEDWSWIWKTSDRTDALGIRLFESAGPRLIGSLAYSSRSDLKRLQHAARNEECSLELW